MFIVLNRINFDDRSIAACVGSCSEPYSYERLRDYLCTCRKLGFTRFELTLSDPLPDQPEAICKRLEDELSVFVSPSAFSAPRWMRRRPPREHQILRASAPGRVNYGITFRNMKTVLAEVTQFVLLIGNSVPLGERALSHLRLCLYELAVNSVEHGHFTTKAPMITVRIGITGDMVVTTYGDNALPFQTTGTPDVDIEQQIRGGIRRGLGLFMVRRLTSDLKFTRIRRWNRTTFTVAYAHATQISDRRSRMEEFSVQITPDSRGFLIIQPKGSIDVSSTHVLEEHFNAAIKNKQYNIAVDLSQTGFISSSGIGIILGTVSSLRGRGGDLVLMNIPDQIADILRILNITEYFRIVSSAEELTSAIE
jgi:anti-sigma B factor antagonist